MNRPPRHDRTAPPSMRYWGMTGGQFLCLILLGFAVAFGLGMIVARFDPSFEDHPKLAQEPPAPAIQTYSVPALGTPEADAAGDVTVETGTPGTPAQKTPEMAKPRSPFMDVSPQLTSLEPLPAQRSRAIQVEAPSREPRPGEATPKSEGEAKAETPPAPSAATAPQPAPAPPAPAPQPQPVTPAPQPAPAPPPQPAAAPATQEPPLLTPITPDEPLLAHAPASGRGSFGIQVSALSGGNRSERAKMLQAQVQQKTGMQAEVIPSEDGQQDRVVVVGFQTRESAAAALNDVRAKTGFKDAFVKAL